MKTVGRTILAGAFLFITFFYPSHANAHTQLISEIPTGNATLQLLPEYVDLTFDEELLIIGHSNQLRVFDPAGKEISEGDVRVINNHLTRKLKASSIPGKYRVSYRVVSQDGHIVENDYFFTLNSDNTSHASPVTRQSSAASPSPSSVTATPAQKVDHQHSEGFLHHHKAHFYLAGGVFIVILLWWIYRKNPITSR
jgi:methionine-rich copper-binding protein CopC